MAIARFCDHGWEFFATVCMLVLLHSSWQCESRLLHKRHAVGGHVKPSVAAAQKEDPLEQQKFEHFKFPFPKLPPFPPFPPLPTFPFPHHGYPPEEPLKCPPSSYKSPSPSPPPPPVYYHKSPPPPVYYNKSPPPPVYYYKSPPPPVYYYKSPPPPVYYYKSPPPPSTPY